MMRLCDITDSNLEIEIKGISSDSRNIEEGYLFVAVNGFNVDHSLFIDDAIKKGAVAVICGKDVEEDFDIEAIKVKDVNLELVKVCQKFYDVNLNEFRIIGITGTDGKTTSSTITKNIINNFEKCAYIGTNGLEIDDLVYPTNNTTPCIEELYNLLNIIKKHDCNTIVMEVSSEALLHNRVDSFKFDVVGYTNITEDHLNVHKTIDNYRDCKFRLASLVKEDGFVINNGDDNNCKMLKYKKMYTYGKNSDNNYVISDVKKMDGFVNYSIKCKDDIYTIDSPYFGEYNLYNVTLAFIICRVLGYDSIKIIDSIKRLSSIRGRREFLKLAEDFDIILDYAHTYNGIKNIVDSVSNYNRVIVVTGAAGGREKEKRALIGKYLLDNSSLVIFTMDDPRYEKVEDIISDMISDTNKTNYISIIDRTEAIYYALDEAKKNDIVLVLGKGRDNYMAIEDKKIPYCDYDVILSYFNK